MKQAINPKPTAAGTRECKSHCSETHTLRPLPADISSTARAPTPQIGQTSLAFYLLLRLSARFRFYIKLMRFHPPDPTCHLSTSKYTKHMYGHVYILCVYACLHYKLSAVLLLTLTHVSLGLTKHWPCL